jgi:hypothetical protein
MQPAGVTVPAASKEIYTLYQQLLEARQLSNCEIPIPSPQQFVAFLERQKEKIREKFGDREVVFRVETEGGIPKIKVRAK